MMRSYTPVGWRGESHRHYLAAKGVRSSWQKAFPSLVKSFPGDNPHLTEDYARFRQEDPKKFVKESFRTKKMNKDTSIILGKDKKTKHYKLQSVLIRKAPDSIKGGLADGIPDRAFNKRELNKGIKVEFEHVDKRNLAKEISKDHLSEDKNYYKKLATIEK